MRYTKKSALFLLCITVLVISSASIIYAQNSKSATMTVSVNIDAQVSVQTTTADFPEYTGITESWTSGNVTVNAKQGVPISIAINGGLNSDGCKRHIVNNQTGGLLDYIIFQPGTAVPYSNWGVEWGDNGATVCGAPYSNIGQGVPVTYFYDAVIPAGLPINSAGMYSDVVIVSVSY